jgi:catechol 2,3-dioxygenase-like lactoylglutathione lyase family enzyme
MSTMGIRGLWHIALRVRDLVRSESFYRTLFGMHVVWRPDPQNVYLSSGADNLALHQIPADERVAYENRTAQFLDHLGLIMESPEAVKRLFEESQRSRVKIVKEPKELRDGSYSFYLADPDDTVVQVLYEPSLSSVKYAAPPGR